MEREELVRRIAELEAKFKSATTAPTLYMMESLSSMKRQLAAIDEAAKKAAATTTSKATTSTEWTEADLERLRSNLEAGLNKAMVDANDDIKAAGKLAVDVALEATKWMGIGMAGYLGAELAGAALATGTAATTAAVPAATTTAAATTAATTTTITVTGIASGIVAGLKDILGKAALMTVAVFLVTQLVSQFVPALASNIQEQMTKAAASIEEVEKLAEAFEEGA